MRWRWRSTKRQEPQSQLPTTPPDPEAIRAQLAAEEAAKRAARREQWVVFMKKGVLPRINIALGSAQPVECQVRMLMIRGSQKAVTVLHGPEYDMGDSTWAKYLISALLDNPAYQGYKIEFFGVRDNGRGYGVDRIELSVYDRVEAARQFSTDSFTYRVRYFEVVIRP